MRGALEDYQRGLMLLGDLVGETYGILEMIQDQVLKDGLFSDFVALDEVHARVRIGDFDFERDGGPVVDRAVQTMLSKIDSHLVLLNRSVQG